MDSRSLEHGLAQKLMIMENAAARVATVRALLRTNADQARKDVRSVMSQQMLLLRAREQELMNELDLIVNHRERALEHQQQLLYKNIWECKQAQKKLKEDAGSNSDAADVLSRMHNVEVLAGDLAHVSFESDAIGLRSVLLSFGTIRTMSKNDNVNKSNLGESLPMEIEEYDDGAVMAHKSLFNTELSPANPNSISKKQVETIRKWLKKMPSGLGILDADMSSIMAEFDFIKNSSLSESESSDSSSSFDVIAQDSAKPIVSPNIEEVLSAEFLNTLRQPLSSWLMRVIPKEQVVGNQSAEVKPSVAVEEPVCSMKRPHSVLDEKHYEFEDVINSVRASNNDGWVLGPKGLKKTCTGVTCAKEDPSTSEQECEAQATPTFNESEFLEHLSNLVVTQMKSAQSNVKGNSSPYEIDLGTVLGWKRALEKTEQSASFWLQDGKL